VFEATDVVTGHIRHTVLLPVWTLMRGPRPFGRSGFIAVIGTTVDPTHTDADGSAAYDVLTSRAENRSATQVALTLDLERTVFMGFVFEGRPT